MRKVIMGLIGFAILLVGIMQQESTAKAEKSLESQMEPSADSSNSADSVITISETINGELRTDVNLPTAVHDNALVEKVVLPKGIDSILWEDYYEYDESIPQNYSSLTPNCPNLKWIEVDKDNKSLMSRDGILYSKDGTKLYYCPPGKSGEVTVPEGVITIDFQAFQDCTKITKINLPSTLKMIHIAAFGGNTGLLEITVPGNNEAFKVIDHALFTKDGKVLYAYAGGREEAVYTLPENVRIISDAVFKNCTNLKEFYANENLSIIKVEAFKNCTNLKTVQLKKGLQVICAGAFMNCTSLTKLDLPEGLTDLYDKAIFECTNLLEISLPESFQDNYFVFEALDDVEGRVIRVYNPFYYAGLNSKKRAKNVTVYTYRGSYTAAQLKKNGLKVAYFEEEYCRLPKQSKAPASAVKGSGKADTSWYDGNKYEFELSTPDQLAGLGVLVLSGIDFTGKTVKLMNDLDLGCYTSWSPIGYSRNGVEYRFRGTFDGRNHTIYHMKLKTYTNNDLGLFGVNEGNISDLNIEDSQILGKDNIGLLAGTNRGSITDCNVSGYVRGQENVGGLVGNNLGSIKTCHVTAEIYGIHRVGGITGINYLMIYRCKTKGTIFGYNKAGGIAGYNCGSDYAYITAAQSEMEVNGYYAVGGITGSCSSTYILDCINYGAVNGNEYVGGVVGGDCFDVNVINCKNHGGITGNYSVGGISGYMSFGIIIYCENEGDVSGFSEIGGILGTLGSVYPDYDRVLISESSTIPTGRYNVGELIGQNLQVNYDY